MSDDDLVELERRVTAALVRIGTAVESMTGPDGVPQTLHDAALAEAERLRTEVDRAALDVKRATERAEAAEAEITRLNEALEAEATANAQLRERNATLKDAKEEAASKAAAAEQTLDSVREQQSSDRAELDALIAALEPLVQEQPHA